MKASEILAKHGKRATKTVKAKAAVEQAVKDRALSGVDKVNKKLAKFGLHISTSQVEQAAETFRKEVAAGVRAKAGSRADLMAQAQAKGIKYFRILSKKELELVLMTNSHTDIDAVIRQARNRWMSGWGSLNKEVSSDKSNSDQR